MNKKVIMLLISGGLLTSCVGGQTEGSSTTANTSELGGGISTYQIYPSGIGGYVGGTIVQTTSGKLFQCINDQVAPWCNQNNWAYNPVDGSYASQAWTEVSGGVTPTPPVTVTPTVAPTVTPTVVPTVTPTVAPTGTCAATWSSGQDHYNGGQQVSLNGVNYQANWWTSTNPSTNSGTSGSGQPWTTLGNCSVTPTNAGTLVYSLVNSSKQTAFTALNVTLNSVTSSVNFGVSNTSSLATGSYSIVTSAVADAASGTYLPAVTQTVAVTKDTTSTYPVSVPSKTASISVPVTITGLANGDSVTLTITDNSTSPYNYNQVSGLTGNTTLKFISGQNVTISVTTTGNYTAVTPITLSKVSASSKIAISLTAGPVSSNKLIVGYLDATSAGGASVVNSNSANYANYDIVVIGFISPQVSVVDSPYSYSSTISAIKAGNPNAKIFLSVGGSDPVGTIASDSDSDATINQQAQNIVAQMNAYNTKFGKKVVDGFDFDVEQAGHTKFINAVTKLVKANGYMISIAPQVNGVNSTSAAPVTGISLVTTGTNPDYNTILFTGLVDYVWTQNYNTTSFTIDGYSELNVNFYTAMGKLLNNAIQTSCAASSASICIPSTTKVLMGAPASQTFGPNSFFNAYGDTTVGQANALTAYTSVLKTLITTVPTYAGAMVWDIDRDVSPALFGASGATPYAYINAVAPVLHSN